LVAANIYSANIWEVTSGQLVSDFERARYALAVAISPDGKRLAFAEADSTIEVFDAETSKWLFEIKRH